MVNKYRILGIALMLASLPVVAQQDFHFSQFFAAPITYNPATSGAFEGDFRATLNYRNQYSALSSAPFQTMGFTADMPIKLSNETYDRNFLGAGIMVINDNSGTVNFNTLHAAGNIAYAIDLGGTNTNPHFMSVGLQVSYIQRTIDFNKASWESQWTGIGFNQGLPTGENYQGKMNESAVSLGAGFSYFRSFNEDTRLLGGVAILNANAPEIQLLGTENNLFRKYVMHAGMSIARPESYITFLPNLFVMFQGPNQIIDIGSEVEFSLWDRTQFTDFRNNLSTAVGAYYRYKDAIYFIGRVNYYDFSLGISYDFTTSNLNKGNSGQGGVELVLSYRTLFNGPGTNRQKLINSKGL
jgi:type IX secretion system PorP/SprF family membrane protein